MKRLRVTSVVSCQELNNIVFAVSHSQSPGNKTRVLLKQNCATEISPGPAYKIMHLRFKAQGFVVQYKIPAALPKVINAFHLYGFSWSPDMTQSTRGSVK